MDNFTYIHTIFLYKYNLNGKVRNWFDPPTLSRVTEKGPNDGIRQGPEPGIGTGGYELGTDGISTDLSNKYR